MIEVESLNKPKVKVVESGNGLNEVQMTGASGCKMKDLLTGKTVQAPNFAMRIFELEPQGHTPFHQHNWEHEIFILAGNGELKTENGNIPFKSQDALFVPPNQMHQFINSGESKLRFICLIPNVSNY